MKKKNNKIKYLLSNQKGAALLTTLIFIFLMVTFVVALLAMTSNDIKLSAMQRDSTKAFYQADGGIEKAIWYLNSSEDNPDGLDFKGTLPRGGVSATEYYDVVVSPTDPGPPEIKTLVSTGTIEGGGKYKQDRVVEVKLKKGIKRSPNLHYDYAVLTDGDLTINGGVTFHGNVHSNEKLTNNGTINMEYGSITATGDIKDNTGSVTSLPHQEFPQIAWDYYESKSKTQEIIDGHTYNNYYDSDVTFSSPETLYGIHFVNGSVTITNELILHNATILATGYIDIQTGNADVHLENSDSANPLALVSKEYIEVAGNATITGDGIIQTEGTFNLGGNVSIKGAVYSDMGIFGGGGGSMNVYYDTDLTGIVVPGTGIPVWVKISWQEVY
jgi:cytoskeletal protein CcmA (bactofilin family)